MRIIEGNGNYSGMKHKLQGRRKSSVLTAALLGAILILLVLSATGAASATTDVENMSDSAVNTGLQSTATENNQTSVEYVTLITGDTVAIVDSANGTQYRFLGNTNGTIYETDTSVYVVPDGVNRSRFDRTLFNVDLLRQQNLTDRESGSLPIIVKWTSDGQSRHSGRRILRRSGSRTTHNLDIINSTSITIPKAQATEVYQRLKTSDRIAHVYYNAKVQATAAPSRTAIDAQIARNRYNVTGEGLTVAVLDSGVNESHPDINGSEIAEKDFTGEETTVDLARHGTAVAGLITGDGTASNDTYVGVAPNTNIVDARVLDRFGDGSVANVIAGFEYALERDVDAISMSLGHPATSTRQNDLFRESIAKASQQDVLVVTSSGKQPGYGSITSPGTLGEVLTVGSSIGDKQLAQYTPQGPTPHGKYVKPNVVAPGSSVRAPGTDGGYRTSKGTSFATPLVTGTGVLVRQAHPGWSDERIKHAITSTADPFSGADVYTQGAGIVNASAAIDTQVLVEPATINFDTVTVGSSESRTFTATNLGNTSRKMNISAEVRSVESGTPDDISLNRTQLHLEPAESATVRVTVRPTDEVSVPHSGRITVGNKTAIFGYTPSRTITVKKREFGSKNNDTVAVVNTDTDRVYGPREIGESTTTFSVSKPGTYVAVSTSRHNGQPVVTANETTVQGEATIILDEHRTVRRSIATSSLPEPASALHNRTVALNATVDGAPYDVRLVANDAGTGTVRVSPTERMTYAVRRVITVSPEAGTFDTPTIYHLKHVTETVGDSHRHDTVNVENLATQHVSYYRSRPNETYSATLAADEFDDVSLAQAYTTGGLADRHEQTIRVSPSIVQYHDSVAFGQSGYVRWTATGQAFVRSLEGGEAIRTAVKKQPYRSMLKSWSLSDRYFEAAIFPTVGQPPRGYVMSDSPREQYTIWINGNRTKTTIRNYATAYLSARQQGIDRVRLRVQDQHGMSPLSNDTVTTFAASTNGSDRRPPAVPDVIFENQSATNVVPNGNLSVTIRTSDTGSGLRNATLYVGTRNTTGSPTGTPFESGAGWREVPLHRTASGEYTATLPLEKYRGSLSVAVRAIDKAGNYVETTATDAVVVGSRRPTPVVTANRTLITVNSTVRLDASNSFDDLGIDSYQWDIDGDGTTDRTTTRPTTTVSYAEPGAVNPTLTVSDLQGFSASTAITTIAVAERLPAEQLPKQVRTDIHDAVITDSVGTAGVAYGRRSVKGDSVLYVTGRSNGGIDAGPNSTVVVNGTSVSGRTAGHNVIARNGTFRGGINASGTVVVASNQTVVSGDLQCEELVRVLPGVSLRVQGTIEAQRVDVAESGSVVADAGIDAQVDAESDANETDTADARALVDARLSDVLSSNASVQPDIEHAVEGGQVEIARKAQPGRTVAAESVVFVDGKTNGGISAGSNSTLVVNGTAVNGKMNGHNVIARNATFHGGINASGTVVVTGNRTVVSGDLQSTETVQVLPGATLQVSGTIDAQKVIVEKGAVSVAKVSNAS